MNDTSPAWLTALVDPTDIVLVGASDDPGRIAGRALAYLRRNGFAGGLHPVNPRRPTIQGLPAYPTVDAVPVTPSLAIISVRREDVRGAVEACAAKSVATAIVYASGFAEQDAGGAALQDELKAAASGSAMRVLGPNCLGAIGVRSGVTASFTSALDTGELRPGPVALITQSGAFASFVYGAGVRSGVRFGLLATTGNEMDLTLSEVFLAAVELDEINTFLLHIEGLRDRDSFVRAAIRARELGKTVAVVKVGSSAVGAEAAMAHTASDVGDADTYRALFAELGVHQVKSMDDMIDVGLAGQNRQTFGGTRAAIISISGGTGVLMADVCAEEGLTNPELSPLIRKNLDAVLPPFASTRNPVDVTGAVLDDLDSFSTVLTECAEDPDTDMLMIAIGNVSTGEDMLTDAIIATATRYPKPVFVTWVGGSGVPAQRLSENGIPTFGDPSRAVRAAAVAARSSLEHQSVS